MSAPANTYWQSFGEDTPYWETRLARYAEPCPQGSETEDGMESHPEEWVEKEKNDLEALLDTLGTTQLSRPAAEGMREYVAVTTFRSRIEDQLTKAEAVRERTQCPILEPESVVATLGGRNTQLRDENRKLRTALSLVPSAEDVQRLRALTTDISNSGITAALWTDLQKAIGSTMAKLSAVNRNKPDVSQPGRSDTDMIET